MNKRGQGLSTNAIVLIVLGVIVLAVLILGFTMGWKNIAPWIGGGNNVDEIGDACSIACSTKSKYDFCSVERELNDGQGNDFKDVTCNYLAQKQPSYGIDTCSPIDCGNVVILETPIEGLADQSALNANVGDDVRNKDLCASPNQGKTIYVLSDNNVLLSVTCAEASV
tara:strand:+ start:748 stop:1251 length:504 start_codon:yes stop_codon:yes gene_type:complete